MSAENSVEKNSRDVAKDAIKDHYNLPENAGRNLIAADRIYTGADIASEVDEGTEFGNKFLDYVTKTSEKLGITPEELLKPQPKKF